MEVLEPIADCTSASVGFSLSDYRFNIPREGTLIQQVVFESSLSYITRPNDGCCRTYSMFMVNGQPVPSYYNLNAETG
jgi:hypothetical protein